MAHESHEQGPRRADVVTQSVLTLLIGIVIGVLGSHAAFASRVATLEARANGNDGRVAKLEQLAEKNADKLDEVLTLLRRR